MANIEPSTYVENLRAELERCMELGQGKDLRFFTDEVKLEVKMGTESEVGGGSSLFLSRGSESRRLDRAAPGAAAPAKTDRTQGPDRLQEQAAAGNHRTLD